MDGTPEALPWLFSLLIIEGEFVVDVCETISLSGMVEMLSEWADTCESTSLPISMLFRDFLVLLSSRGNPGVPGIAGGPFTVNLTSLGRSSAAPLGTADWELDCDSTLWVRWWF